MASMIPELELMIFMTPIFTDKAELALEVFNVVVREGVYSGWFLSGYDGSWIP